MDGGGIRLGPLTRSCVHLCVDMQNLVAEATQWHTPWIGRVLPAVERLAHHNPARTILTRFIPRRQPHGLRRRVAPVLCALAYDDVGCPLARRDRTRPQLGTARAAG